MGLVEYWRRVGADHNCESCASLRNDLVSAEPLGTEKANSRFEKKVYLWLGS